MSENNWDSRFEMMPIEKDFFEAASRLIPDLKPKNEASNGKYRSDLQR